MWTFNNVTIEFNNFSITAFSDRKQNKERKVESIDDIMYIYYNVVISQKNKYKDDTEMNIRVGDWPNIWRIQDSIQRLVKKNTKKTGYLYLNRKDGKSIRKNYMDIIEIGMPSDGDCFLKIEKHIQLNKWKDWKDCDKCNHFEKCNEDCGNTYPNGSKIYFCTEKIYYKMLIGQMTENNEYNTGVVMFLDYIPEEKIIEFGKYSEETFQKEIQEYQKIQLKYNLIE